ncbi:MAG TPA: hypothetical protein VEF76_14105 [Patescibacteria group bacterium]|nr:hypothetical protein [Patescibacteria group bacterium]
MQRIVVLGCTGSGKTTFGKKLALILGCPAVDLDELYWLPGWQGRETPDFRARTAESAAGERWVIMGNYSKVRDIVWNRATTFIWLDYPFYLIFWQLCLRSVRRARDKTLICNGNVETWRKLLLSKDSIVWWLCTTYRKRKREYGAVFDAGKAEPARYIRLRSRAEAAAFLDNLNPASV